MNDQLALFDAGRPSSRNGSRKKPPREDITAELSLLGNRIEELEGLVQQIYEAVSKPQLQKEAYTTAEVAKLLGKRPYTVREWARLGRVNAYKVCGRGAEDAWRITHEELVRIQNDGLLPRPERY